MSLLKRLVKEEHAQGMVEYALLIALLSIVAYKSIQSLGKNVNTKFNDAATKMR